MDDWQATKRFSGWTGLRRGLAQVGSSCLPPPLWWAVPNRASCVHGRPRAFACLSFVTSLGYLGMLAESLDVPKQARIIRAGRPSGFFPKRHGPFDLAFSPAAASERSKLFVGNRLRRTFLHLCWPWWGATFMRLGLVGALPPAASLRWRGRSSASTWWHFWIFVYTSSAARGGAGNGNLYVNQKKNVPIEIVRDMFEKASHFAQPFLLNYSTLLFATLLYSTLLYCSLLFSTLRYSTLLYSSLLFATLLYSSLLFFAILLLYYSWLCDLVRISEVSHLNFLWLLKLYIYIFE